MKAMKAYRRNTVSGRYDAGRLVLARDGQRWTWTDQATGEHGEITGSATMEWKQAERWLAAKFAGYTIILGG